MWPLECWSHSEQKANVSDCLQFEFCGFESIRLFIPQLSLQGGILLRTTALISLSLFFFLKTNVMNSVFSALYISFCSLFADSAAMCGHCTMLCYTYRQWVQSHALLHLHCYREWVQSHALLHLQTVGQIPLTSITLLWGKTQYDKTWKQRVKGYPKWRSMAGFMDRNGIKNGFAAVPFIYSLVCYVLLGKFFPWCNVHAV